MSDEKRNTGSRRYLQLTQDLPDGIVQTMYLELTNIVQGFCVTVLIISLAGVDWGNLINNLQFSVLIFGLTSFFISIIFWTRYYFDTYILQRSFQTIAIVWFFAYVVVEGMSFTYVTKPVYWLASTALFLLFGSIFYAFNLSEIKRKHGRNDSQAWESYKEWQKQRLVELFVLSVAAFCGAYIVMLYSHLDTIVGVVAITAGIWQLAKTDDYRKNKFIHAGK